MRTIHLIIFISLFFSPLCFAQQRIFLNLDGIKGESTGSQHEGEIDILNISSGVSTPVINGSSGDREAARASFSLISLVKYIDISTPPLLLHVANGAHIAMAKITVTQSDHLKTIDYYKIELTNVRIAGVESAGNSDGDRMTERVTLAFDTIKYSYTPVNQEGAQGPVITSSWNISENRTSD